MVLMGWQYFFAAPATRDEKAREEFSREVQAQREGAAPQGPPSVATTPDGAPAAPQSAQSPQAPIARAEALKQSPRVAIKTASLEGSIALKSGRIDDLVLAKYREQLDPNSPKVTLLSPADSEHPYFAEYGWVAQSGSTQKLPDRDTVWTVESGDTLTPAIAGHHQLGQRPGPRVPPHASRSTRTTCSRSSTKSRTRPTAEVSLLPYARIHRYGTPKTTAFYILHEGLIGVAGEQGLQEVTYADAVSRQARPRRSRTSSGGWFGITDKYWAAALVPIRRSRSGPRCPP